jgi:RING-variant domain
MEVFPELELICRICFEVEVKNNRVISPCKCSGSCKYVHKNCLREWLSKKFIEFSNPKCEVCDSPYVLKIKKRTFKSFLKKIQMHPKLFLVILFDFFLIISFPISILAMTYLDFIGPRKQITIFCAVIFIGSVISLFLISCMRELIAEFGRLKTVEYSIDQFQETIIWHV